MSVRAWSGLASCAHRLLQYETKTALILCFDFKVFQQIFPFCPDPCESYRATPHKTETEIKEGGRVMRVPDFFLKKNWKRTRY
jgi:hypothetical protein